MKMEPHIQKIKTVRLNYKGKYLPRGIVEEIRSGVIIALTGSGKTSAFEGKAFTLILVPRVLQATMNERENTYQLMDALTHGSVIITYNKFLGHMNVPEFNDMIQNGVYRIIVDESHTLVAKKNNSFRTIYALNAIFLSGTIDETFRPDLTHYKFIPECRTKIYYTDGIVPDFEHGLYFVERAKALMRNYSENCIVGAEHKFKNVDPHTHVSGKVFATSSLREGVSISNDVFDAAVVVANYCPQWTIKDNIQAVNRLRSDHVTRIVTKAIINKERSRATTEWAVKSVNRAIHEQDRNVNTVDAKMFNLLLDYGTTEGYLGVCPYGIACFLSKINANHYDEELYEFMEYTEPTSVLLISTKTIKVSSGEDEMLEINFGGNTYIFEPRYEKRMNDWIKLQVDNGYNTLIPKLMKLNSVTNLNNFYEKGSIAKKMKTMYNRANKRKYNREMFIRDISKIVEVELSLPDGKVIKRITQNTDLKTLNFKVISECPVPCDIRPKAV